MKTKELMEFLSGLVIFLFAVTVCEKGLRKISENRLKEKLLTLSDTELKGITLGAAVTAVLQSSSAVTAMLVSMAEAEVLSLEQCFPIVMGSNLGTSTTAWFVSFLGINGNRINFLHLYPVTGIIGIMFIFLLKNNRCYSIGLTAVGFTLLMSGISTMSNAVKPLSENSGFINMMINFDNPFLGVILGAVVTAVIQSSSASIGILQTFCATGSIRLKAAIPIILGQNIGTCSTALLSCAGGGRKAKSVAAFHLLFNLGGAAVWLAGFVVFEILSDDNPIVSAADVAMIHTVFNLSTTLGAILIKKIRRGVITSP